MYYKHKENILIRKREHRQRSEFKEYLERNKEKIAKAKHNWYVKKSPEKEGV